jgi:hypothetical protein
MAFSLCPPAFLSLTGRSLKSMHRALALGDVLRLIIEHLDHSSAQQHQTYLPLTLVNHAFCEHALDQLWKEPPLFDLALLMDEDCFYVEHSIPDNDEVEEGEDEAVEEDDGDNNHNDNNDDEPRSSSPDYARVLVCLVAPYLCRIRVMINLHCRHSSLRKRRLRH